MSYNNDIFNKTAYYQKKYGFKYNTNNSKQPFWNNEADAFKHTFMEADLTFKWGSGLAKLAGDVHEAQNLLNGNSKNETNMDLWNNKVGRQIGQEVLKEMRAKHKLGEKKNWKEIDDAIAEKVMQKMKNDELITSPDDPRARTIMEKVKDNLKTPQNFKSQNFSSENTGLSNSTSVSSQLIQVPQNAPMLNADYLANLGQLGQTGSVGGAIMGMIGGLAGVALGAGISNYLGSLGTVNAQIYSGPAVTLDGVTFGGGFHTGGTVPGQGEVLALLKGGESVRTKAQEEELRKTLYEKYASDYAPMVCGEDQNQEDKTSRTKKEDMSTKPIHQQVTKDDEAFFLNLILDAIDRNRMGMRTKLKGLV